MKVLIIKTSSLGDIFHLFTALTDAGRELGGVQFDWVVEESFAAVPRWHPLVDRVIPIALRRWRKKPWRISYWKEARAFLRDLQLSHYDFVVDAQGLIKSGVITRLARGMRVGLNKKSLTESLARFAYQKTVDVDLRKQAVFRMRSLLAQALDYDFQNTEAHYGMSAAQFPVVKTFQRSYILFLHGTTWPTKHWPDDYWIELAKLVEQQGYQVVLPWSNEKEKARADKISAAVPTAIVLEKLSLTDMASVIAHAAGVVTVDTGLGHLAAGLNVPTVSLYGPTDPARTGTVGRRQVALQSDFECVECDRRDCRYRATTEKVWPACFSSLTPALVLKTLSELL